MAVKSGIDGESAKKIQVLVKQSKLKVQAAIQGDAVRVTGAKRDELQAAIALLKREVTDLPLTFTTSASERAARLLLAALLPCLSGVGAAQSVQFAGSMGTKALLVIDGQARTLAVGESHAGVRLLSLTDGVAAGRAQRQRQCAAARRGAGGAGQCGACERRARDRRHGGNRAGTSSPPARSTAARCNSWSTPAPRSVAIGQAEAESVGLDWRGGKRALSSTANGAVPVHLLTLNSVRVGEVEVANVERRRAAGADALRPARQQLSHALPDAARKRRDAAGARP